MIREVGQKGEAIAARYLPTAGAIFCWVIITGTRMGELDLILYKEELIVFAEVKTRTGRILAAPAEAVDLLQAKTSASGGRNWYLQNSPFAEARVRLTWWM